MTFSSVLASRSVRVSPAAANLATSSNSSPPAHEDHSGESGSLPVVPTKCSDWLSLAWMSPRPPGTKHSICSRPGLGDTLFLRPGTGVNSFKPEENEVSAFTTTSQGLLQKEGRRGTGLALQLMSTVLGNTRGLRKGNSTSRVKW